MARNHLKQFETMLRRACDGAVRQFVTEEMGVVKHTISKPQRGNTKEPVVRSKPGEPPRAGVTRHPLLDSVKATFWANKGEVGGAISAGPVYGPRGEEYAKKLELGGGPAQYYFPLFMRDTTPRPFLFPAYKRMGQNIPRFAEMLKARFG